MKKSFGLIGLLVVALSASASAGPDKLEFDLSFISPNECDATRTVNSQDIAKVTVSLRSDSTIDVKFRYMGTGLDDLGGEYRVRAEGDATFTSLAAPQSFPYVVSFIGKGDAPSFDGFGDITIVDVGGFPAVTTFAPGTYTCIGH